MLCVILRLRIPKLKVFSRLVCQKLGMASFLDDLPLMEYGDLVAELAGGQTVGNIDSSLITGDVIELALDFSLGNGVEGSGGFVEDDEGRVLIKRPSESDLLRFAAGDLHASGLKILIKRGMDTVRHGG